MYYLPNNPSPLDVKQRVFSHKESFTYFRIPIYYLKFYMKAKAW